MVAKRSSALKEIPPQDVRLLKNPSWFSRFSFRRKNEELPFPELEKPREKISVRPAKQKKIIQAPPYPHQEALSPLALDPWKKCLELVQKCQKSLRRSDVDFAEIYFAELTPFYSRLSQAQKQRLYPFLHEAQQQMAMLRLKRLRQRLKKEVLLV